MISRLIRILQSPHECGHAMVLANGFPGLPLPMVKIAAYICGFTVFQIQPSTLVLGEKYAIEHFKLDIVNAYTTAGLKVCCVMIHIMCYDTMSSVFDSYQVTQKSEPFARIIVKLHSIWGDQG